MAIFTELKKNFAVLGIKPDGQSRFNKKHSMIAFSFALCSIAMGAFILFEPKSLMEFTNSFYGAACAILNFFTFSSNVLNRTKIFVFLDTIEDIIKKRSHRATVYEKISEKIEKLTKITHVTFVHITFITMFVTSFIASYWLYYTTDLGSKAFKLSFMMSMPFDWRTPLGYAIAMAMLSGAWIFVLISCSCILSFVGGACWLFIALAEDLNQDIRNLKEAKSNEAVLKTKLNDVIEFHCTAKQLVNDFSKIYEIIITGYYLWSISTIGCSLFFVHFGTSKGNSNLIELLFAIILIFWSFIQMFIFCNLGEIMSNQFNEVNNSIYSCDWYKFPRKIQRLLPVIMISADKPVALIGFANFTCSREAFKKVVNGGFSYFMMFRRMYN